MGRAPRLQYCQTALRVLDEHPTGAIARQLRPGISRRSLAVRYWNWAVSPAPPRRTPWDDRTTSKKTRRGPREICRQSPGGGLSGRRRRATGPAPPAPSLSRPGAPVGGAAQPATRYSKKEAGLKRLPVAISARVSSDQQTDAHPSARQLAALRARVAPEGFAGPAEMEWSSPPVPVTWVRQQTRHCGGSAVQL